MTVLLLVCTSDAYKLFQAKFHLKEDFTVVYMHPFTLSRSDQCGSVRFRDGDVARLVEHQTVTPLMQVRFPGVARDFSPRDNFQCRLLCVSAPPPPPHV